MGNVPSPSLPFPFPPFLPSRSSLPIPDWSHENQLGDLGEHCKPPQWCPEQKAGRKHILVYFELGRAKKRTHQAATFFGYLS